MFAWGKRQRGDGSVDLWAELAAVPVTDALRSPIDARAGNGGSGDRIHLRLSERFRVLGASRAWPKGRAVPGFGRAPATAVVVVVGLAVTATLTLGARSVHDSNERRLLRQRARESGDVLAATIQTLQTPLTSAAQVAEATDASQPRVASSSRPWPATRASSGPPPSGRRTRPTPARRCSSSAASRCSPRAHRRRSARSSPGRRSRRSSP